MVYNTTTIDFFYYLRFMNNYYISPAIKKKPEVNEKSKQSTGLIGNSGAHMVAYSSRNREVLGSKPG